MRKTHVVRAVKQALGHAFVNEPGKRFSVTHNGEKIANLQPSDGSINDQAVDS